MSQVIDWPPKNLEAPPSVQFEIGRYMDIDCICSHLEPQLDGTQAPHFVVDCTYQPSADKPYPFLPSIVPDFLKAKWLENSKINKPYVKKNIKELFDKHWGLPIYVVGTGPSLNKNMDELRKVKDGIIIATNDAINILPDDIKIDYYVCVDGRFPAGWWEN